MAISAARRRPTAVFRGKRLISRIRCALSPDRRTARPMTANGGRDGPTPVRRLYGRSRGKALRPGQERLLAEALPLFSIEPEALGARRAFAAPPREVWREIGLGSGEHLIDLAKAHPAVAIVVCEPFLNRAGAALGRLAR